MPTTEASAPEALVDHSAMLEPPLLRPDPAGIRLRRLAGAPRLSPIRERLLRYILDTHRQREQEHQRGLNSLSAGA